MPKSFSRWILSLIAVMAAALSLFGAGERSRAEETPAIVDYLLKAGTENFDAQVSAAYGKLEREGERLVLEEVSYAVKAKGRMLPLGHVARVIIDKPGQTPDGLLTAASVRYEEMEVRIPAVNDAGEPDLDAPSPAVISVPSILVEDLSILPKEAAKTDLERLNIGHVVASRFRVPEVRVRFKNGDVLVIKDIEGSFEGNRRTGTGHMKVDFGRIEVPVSAAAQLGREDALGGLGYARFVFTGGFESRGSWDEKKRGHLDLALRLGMEGAGELAVSIEELVLPYALIEAATDKNFGKKIDAALADPTSPLGRLLNEEVTLRGLRVAWKDEGLASRLLAKKMKETGMSREQIIAAWSAYPQSLLFVFGLPQVALSAQEAMKAFLENPRSLEISIAAKAPMNFATLVTLLEDPKGLTESLNLAITANGGGR